ncbi:Kelch repeat-containing protein [Nocardioides sp. LML1-1-1.1]|uniref:RCC1 domain-containing protein n=1 Tax=Nocardioides sp. LML1-1-1.1 TaxID=3135248 RepID=UPI003418E608
MAALVVVALLASVLAVVALNGERRAPYVPFDVAGKRVDTATDPLDPMPRPKGAKGVALEAPEEPAVARDDALPTTAKKACRDIEDDERSAPGRGGLDGTESVPPKAEQACSSSATAQSPDAVDAPPLTLAGGHRPAPVPTPAPTEQPTEQPTDPPSDQPTEESSGTPSAEPSDEPGESPGSPPPSSTPPSSTPAPSGSASPSTGRPGGSLRVQPAMAVAAKAAPAGEYLSPNWIKALPLTHPGVTANMVMAYDDNLDKIVMFGGRTLNDVYLNQTWAWSGTTWQQLSPATSPSPRIRASMAWDPVGQRLLLFGGQTTGGTPSNEVWSFDGTTWALVTTTGTAPIARTGSSMAFDPVRGGMVVFGGTAPSGNLNDTWLLTGNAWTQVQAGGAAGAPGVRFDAQLAYSVSTSQLVLFGGTQGPCNSSCTILDDTWVLEPGQSTWTAKAPAHKPAKRTRAAITYDPGLGGVTSGSGGTGAVVMFGGFQYDSATSQVTVLNDTWAWTGEDWAEAKGIASPVARYSAAMAADPKGQVVLFGGIGANGTQSYDETWTYDTAVPVLKIDVTRPASDQPTAGGVYWAGDKITIRITAANVSAVAPIGGGGNPLSLVSALQDSLLAAGTGFLGGDPGASGGLAGLAKCVTGETAMCGLVQDLSASISNVTIPIGGTTAGEFIATVAGTQKGCELIDIPAVASLLTGPSAQVSTRITVCGGGLGLEDWWTYDTTDLGGGGSASVNVANGNLVVKQYDTDPVQMPGRLALGLGRVYNSQDNMSGAGPIGAGWQFDLGDTGESAGGFGLFGLRLLNLQTLTQPLSMPYIDRDGTRHVFKLRSITTTVGGLSLPIDLSSASGGQILSLLNPASLPFALSRNEDKPTDYSRLCIDQAYSGPPGSNMFLFRYVGLSGTSCTGGTSSNQSIGWSLVRPDRVRYDFDLLGRLMRVTDPAGQQLVYEDYDTYGPQTIRTQSCPEVDGACPSVKIKYNKDPNAADRIVEVTDPARRVTTYVVSRDPLLPLLKQVWEPGNPYSASSRATPTASYTYATADHPCPASVGGALTSGQLCSVTDANGKTTTIGYEKAPLGPDRVKLVKDRRASEPGDGATQGLATSYTWTDPSTNPQGGVVKAIADMAAPSTLASCGTTCHRVRYSGIDRWGRVAQVAQGTTGGAEDGLYYAQTGYFWDGLGDSGGIASCGQPTVAMNHNLCQVIKRAAPSNAAFVPGGAGTGTVDGAPVQDQAVDYLYGDFGQRLRQRVLLDATQQWTDANSAVTTWGSHEQYFDANGNRRFFNNHVRGNGVVKATAAGGTYRQAVVADGPVAYWRMDEDPASPLPPMGSATGTNNGGYGAGTVLGRPGVVHGNTALGSSPSGWSAAVTGLSGFASGTSAGDSDFTVETWTKTASSGAEYTLQWGSSANAYGLVGRLAGGLPFVSLVSDAASSKQLLVYTTAAVNDDTWHHVVYRYNGNGKADGVEIWIDGVKAPTAVYADALAGQFAPATTTGYVGLSSGAETLDEVALYSSVLSADQIQRHYSAALGATRVKPDTLYAVIDETQELSPRGNAAANAGSWGDFLTSTRRDIPSDGDAATSTNKAAGASICGSAPRGNTGVVCEVDTPAAAGVSRGAACTASTARLPAGSPVAPASSGYASSCTTYEYNARGQRTVMRTPKANSEGRSAAFEYKYYPIVADCAGDNRAACDLSGTVSAGGWLKAVVDPEGKKLVYAYDVAGNVARTWDRNAADGKDLAAVWADAAAPPSTKFTDSVSGNPVTSDGLSVSNTALVAINPDGTVNGAGANASGELGDGTTSTRATPVRADPMTNVVQVAQSSTGAYSGCAYTHYLTGDGKVWTAGGGKSTPEPVEPLSDIISIASGGCHFLALDAEGNLWSWGMNNYGQVGNGTASTYVATPVKVLQKVATMGAGFVHSLAVTTDGKAWSWGYNGSGQLGHGDTVNRTAPAQVAALDDAGIRQVSGGYAASYAIGRDGRVWAFGNNSQGDLGDGTATTRTTPVRITTLGPGTTAGPVRQVVGAAYGAVALMADGTVRVWGINNAGQSGGGSSSPTMPSPVKVPDLTGQVAVAGGWATLASADQAGRIKVWGATSNNQLANGTAPTSTATPTVAGLGISPYKTALWAVLGARDATGNLTTTTRDKLGQARRTRTGRGNDITTSAFDKMVGYDAAGRIVWSSGAQHRSSSSVARTTYDPFGNPVKTVDARGIAFRATFDALNRPLTSQSTRETSTACAGSATSADWTAAQAGHRICTTSTTYDGLGQTIAVTDANSQVTKTRFDAGGRNIRVDTPRNSGRFTGANAWVVSRSVYDREGHVTTACSPRQADTTETQADGSCDASSKYATHTSYDAAGNVVTATKHRIGDTPSALTTSFEYDADRNQVAVTDANGHRTTTAYDLLARRTSQTVPRSGTKTFTTGWSYDASGNVTAVRAPGSINTGSGADGHLVVDGTTAASSTDGIAHGASNPFQVPDGAQYRSVTLQNGAVITSAVANGLMLHASGTVSICSTCVVQMGGKGGAGGAAGTGADSGNGSDAATPNPGPGGKGGSGGLLGLDPSGGGGGGHRTDGGAAGPAGTTPGAPGKASGTPDFATVGTDYVKGSGGGGGGGGKNLLGTAGAGGNGGGYVRITASKIVVNGTIDASGADGGSGINSSGGGGGGAGGGIWLAAPDIDLASANVLDVTGGDGGAGPTDRQGGNGAVGRIRIDADTVSNVPAGTDRTRAAMVTAVSYDAANRPVDTVEGAQTTQANPTLDATASAVPNANGLSNTRTRNIYDADGHVVATLPPQAFSDAASLTAPNLSTVRRVDFDLDGLPVAAYTPRFDNSASSATTSVGAGADGGGTTNQQTAQCTTNRVPDQAAGPGNGATPASYTVLPSSYGSQVGVCAIRSSYDPIGKVKRAWLPTSSGSDNAYLDYTYTDDALVASVSGPDPSGAGRVTLSATSYDGMGRATRVTDANGNGTQTEYTADGLAAKTIGQAYDPDGSGPLAQVDEVTTIEYDAGGHVVKTTDPESRITTQAWTSDDLLSRIDAPGPVSGQTATTRYGYDAVGNTTQTWQPNAQAGGWHPVRNEFTDDNLLAATHTPIDDNSYRSVRYAYSPAGLKVSTESARCASGDWSQCVPGNGSYQSAGFVRLTYGANGRPASQVGRDRDPTEGPTTSITTTYSQQGTPVKVIDPTSGITVEAGYYLDGTTRSVTESGTGLAGSGSSNTYAYNGGGAVTVRTDKTGASGVTNGATVASSYRYNQAGLPEAMYSDVLDVPTSYSWDKAGRLTTAQTGSHYDEWSWQPNDVLAGAKTTANGTVVGEYKYQYLADRSVKKQTVTGSGGGYTNDYEYTPARQVKKWTHDAVSGGGTDRTVDYEWDRNSNRTKVTDSSSGGSTTTTSYGQDNAIKQAVVSGGVSGTLSYVYDRAGRMTNDGCNAYTYDAFDRVEKQVLTSGTLCGTKSRTTSYAYDGLDRQRATTVSGAGDANGTMRNTYDGLSTTVVGQLDAVNGTLNKPDLTYQLDAAGAAVAFEQTGAGPTKSFLDTDGRGNVTAVVSTAQTIDCAARFDPFGNAVDAQTGADSNGVCHTGGAATTTGNSYWYRGQVRDASTGNYQLGTRTYDPTKAAFTTPDAYRVSSPSTDLGVGTDPLTANTYTYVNGNPLNFGDPDGHRAVDTSGDEVSPCVIRPSSCAPVAPGKTTLKAGGGSSAWLGEYKRGLRGTRSAASTTDYRTSDDPTSALFRGLEINQMVSELAEAERQKDDRNWFERHFTTTVTLPSLSCLTPRIGPRGRPMCDTDGVDYTVGELITTTALVARTMLVPDPSACVGADASVASCALEVAALAPSAGKIAKLRKLDKLVEASADLEHASDVAKVCSFSGDTLVLMADGTRKPIKDIRVDDLVLASDPITHVQGARRVSHLWVHWDDLTELVLNADGDRDGVLDRLVTTEDHPFWNATDRAWEGPQEFDAGDRVLSAQWGELEALGLDLATTHRGLAYNLTVDGLHTYHVGALDLLVHNSDVCPRRIWQITDARSLDTKVVGTHKYSKQADGTWWSRDTAGHASAWKVYKEVPGGLEWYRDADQYGNYIDPALKHKSNAGKSVRW